MVNVKQFANETIYIEYIGFFKTEANAKAYGTEAKTTTPPTTDTVTALPKTVDPIVFAAIIPAIASLGTVISHRRKKSD